MSQLALEGLQAERDALLATLGELSVDEWNAASGAPGWRVRDLVAHIAATHHGVVDPAVLPGKGGNEERVRERQAWSIEQVVDEFATYTEQSQTRFAAAQHSDRVMTMGAFGTHPASSLADLYLFDMYGHSRADLFGPLARAEPPRDEARLQPTIAWMMAALAPMCGEALHPQLDAPLTITLSGPGSGTWCVARDNGAVVVRAGDAPDRVATIRSSDHEFVVWGSQRRSWRELASVDGDVERVAPALDAIRVF
jgi:uncharacterized protein (TIGR03083 family)